MLEGVPQDISRGEKLVLTKDRLYELCQKVEERRADHPDEEALISIRRILVSSNVPKEDRNSAREEISAEFLRRLNQKALDRRHDAHWTVRARLDD